MISDYEDAAKRHLKQAQEYADKFKDDDLPLHAELARHHREMAHTYAILARGAEVRR